VDDYDLHTHSQPLQAGLVRLCSDLVMRLCCAPAFHKIVSDQDLCAACCRRTRSASAGM